MDEMSWGGVDGRGLEGIIVVSRDKWWIGE